MIIQTVLLYDSEAHKVASVDSEAMIYYYDDPFEVVSLTRTNLEGYYGLLYVRLWTKMALQISSLTFRY